MNIPDSSVIIGRIPWVDNVKALAICFVIFFHEIQFWTGGGIYR